PQARHQARLLLLAGPGLEQWRLGMLRPLGPGPAARHGRLHRQGRRAAGERDSHQLRRVSRRALWDTACDMNHSPAAKLDALLKLKPGIIVNNRLGGGFAGDTETPEQTIPPTGFKDRDWETCMTMNDTWGYKRDDHDWKPAKVLIRNLIDIASKGGNYLL